MSTLEVWIFAMSPLSKVGGYESVLIVLEVREESIYEEIKFY